jgi:thioredoxin
VGLLSKLFGGETIHPTPVRTVGEFRELVTESELPVIVDMWSPTCGPCKRLGPVLTKVATKYKDRVRVIEIDTSTAQREVLAGLNISAVPTLILYEAGEEFHRITGYRPPSWFDEMIATEFPSQA